MKFTTCSWLSLLILLLSGAAALAQVPQLINYQGRVVTGGTNFNGSGQFKFALVGPGGTPSFWSNDGSSVNGSEPGAAVSLTVVNGLYSVLLGDALLPNMTVIPATVFNNPDVRLRIWFNDGASGFQLLLPDQRIAAVGYAMMSASVPDGAITESKLANGAVTSAKIGADAIGAIQIAPGAVNSSDIANGSILGEDIANETIGSLQLGDNIDLGSPAAVGSLTVFRTAANTPAITLTGSDSRIATYGSDGSEKIRLSGTAWGSLQLFDSIGGQAGVNLGANANTGGTLSLNNSNGQARASLSGANGGGTLTLYQADGASGLFLDGDEAGGGSIRFRDTNGNTRIIVLGQSVNNGGEISVLDDTSTETVEVLGKASATTGGLLTLRKDNGVATVSLRAEASDNRGADLSLNNSAGNLRAFLDADNGDDAGAFYLYTADGGFGVTMDGDSGGGGLLSIYNTNTSVRVRLDGNSTGNGGEISVFDASGTETVEILGAESSAAGGQILMRNAAGVNTIQLDSDASGVACGYLALYRSNGVANIILDSNDGTVQGQVIEITGGADFSERFDIRGDALEPGMIVSIDPKNPGQLALSASAYDRKVAGVISGAGGVKPGMLMGQRGSVADGQHPVALTGRVYCRVDADANGAIEPGDMLTTSPTPGHGMKVSDHSRATGAIIGKAMTALDKGKGLVLVLVNLQ